MNNKKIKSMNIITAICIIILLLAGLVVSIYHYKKTDFTPYMNTIRILLDQERNKIEQGIYPKSEYEYIVFDVSGKVTFSSPAFHKTVGDYVNIEEMIQMDHSFTKQYPGFYKYSFVLKGQDICDGFVVYLIPRDHVADSNTLKTLLYIFMPVVCSIVLSVLLILLRTVYCNTRVLKPLLKISSSAQAIISGNYDMEVQRVFDEELKANEVGDLTYSFELMRDELKAKQLSEQSLKQSQQELISCISHDLRTPISTIKAYSEGIRDGIANDEEQRKDFVRIIIEKTDLLEGMIAELLTYSNTQLNQLTINKKEVYFQSYMKEIVRELKIFTEQQDIAFESSVETQDFMICIDTKRITEVLYNLVENSIKYLKPDVQGIIKLVTKIEKNMLEIHVIDNGIGIQVEDIPYVFDKFYRAEKSRSSDIPGSGLGLSICKYIINQHGGEISCKSGKAIGSEFWFTLPLSL